MFDLLLPGLFVQYFDSVGYNESNAGRAGAIASALQSPHVLLTAEKPNSKVDVEMLIKTRAFRESFMAHRQGRPGSYSAAVHLSW